MKLTLTFNQLVISLLTIATAGVVNTELQTRIDDMDNVVAPMQVQAQYAPQFEESESTITSSITSSYDRVNAIAAREADLNREHLTFELKSLEAFKAYNTPETIDVEIIDVDENTDIVVEDVVAEQAPVERVIYYPTAGTWEYDLLVLVNQAREENGLAPLSYSGDLQSAAVIRASESSVSFSHTRPDGSDFWTVNSAIVFGENIAAGQTSAQQVFAEWMASPGHRANILSADYQTVGFGMVNNGDGVYNMYWAQEFGY